ncbi:alpha-E domain-containing protein [Haliscomenobacter sp.]|uniref:alpha-E domain-containing protein n=1 Tax=Haliscomenobacter sp. TaxID=2717303 RepID=UPI003364ECC7
MLARIANTLYWMGRYLERTEHMARYLRVQYFTTQDAPMSQNRDFVLGSIVNMAGISWEEGKPYNESEILHQIALDTKNPMSILSAITNARENARGMRNIISTELWEVINKYYHFVNNYPVNYFKTRGLYDFTLTAGEHCSVIRGYVDSTLTHNEVWALIRLGVHMERTTQIARIISCKLYDIFVLTNGNVDMPVENYQYTVLLKLLESFDMNRHHYKAAPDRQKALEFLILNADFPRSLAFNLRQIQYFVRKLGLLENSPESVGFIIGRLCANYQYLLFPEIENRVGEFVSETMGKIYEMHEALDKKYFQV